MKTIDRSVPITLGGESYRLAYPICALMALEKHFGVSLLNGTAKMDPKNLTDVIAFVWAGLLHEHPDLTLDEVARKIYPSDLPALNAAIELANNQAKGSKSKANGKARPLAGGGEAQSSIGKRSGPSAATTSD